ncbi:MAG: hypothetical protein SH850_09610 [Planctomycetaceae bacterium]|nr:hypothetical protein [Planctomycetaceae bacterium]
MNASPSEPVEPEPLVWEAASTKPKVDPGSYVLRTRWFIPLTVLGTIVAWLAIVALAMLPPWGLIAGVIGGALFGLMLTLAATAWAVAIVFADDTRRGLWFVLFPPAKVVYAVQRWSWMAQPTILFLCGLVLAFGAPYAAGLSSAKDVEPAHQQPLNVSGR